MKDNIRTFLANHKLLSLATTLHDEPWLCTVYYAEDDNMALYFITARDNRHAKEIALNPTVAYAIYDSNQLVADDKEGFQATGICTMITETQEIETALKIWHQKNPGVEDHINLDYVSGERAKSALFKINPIYMKHFNEALYGEKKIGEWRS